MQSHRLSPQRRVLIGRDSWGYHDHCTASSEISSSNRSTEAYVRLSEIRKQHPAQVEIDPEILGMAQLGAALVKLGEPFGEGTDRGMPRMAADRRAVLRPGSTCERVAERRRPAGS